MTLRIGIFAGAAFGHINPMLPLCHELSAYGHDVQFNGLNPSFKTHINESNVRWFEGPSSAKYDHTVFPTNMVAGNVMLLQTILETLDPLVLAMQQAKLDLIIHDSMAPWARYAADLVGIPRINSFSTFAINFPLAMLSTPPSFAIQELVTGREFLGEYFRLKRQLKMQFRISTNMHSLYTNTGNQNVVYTTREIQPLQWMFPQRSFSFLGPSLRQESEKASVEKGIIYISLGTVTRNQNFWDLLLKTTRLLPNEKFVLSIGHLTKTDDWQTPENVEIHRSVNQHTTLQRSKLFLTHSGMNSAHESLLHGVPTILFPQQPEQALVAKQLKKLGTGCIGNEKSTPQDLKKTIEAILQNMEVHRNVVFQRDRLNGCNALREFAERIESVAKKA